MPSNTLLINAKAGYLSYLWQDGSTDSLFQVTTPGTYHVQVEDACGDFYKDTIIVSAALPILFSVGPDRAKCNKDTVHLNAPAGFLNYSWKTANGTEVDNAASIVINPNITTTYLVQAEKTRGCFAYDTVLVTVHHSPQINLGTDTSLCAGDSLLLDAGDDFSRYLWDAHVGGQVTSSIIARTKGAYSVQAWDENGCLSKDTLWIREVFALPVLTLDKNKNLCAGSTRTLTAGNGFTAYKWSTGIEVRRSIKIFLTRKPGDAPEVFFIIQAFDLSTASFMRLARKKSRMKADALLLPGIEMPTVQPPDKVLIILYF